MRVVTATYRFGFCSRLGEMRPLGHLPRQWRSSALVTTVTTNSIAWFCILVAFVAIRGVRADLDTFVTASSNYEIQVTAATMDFRDPEYIAEGGYMRAFRKARNAPRAVYAFYPILKNLPADMNSSYVCYQKMSNKWMESFIKGTIKLCSILESKSRFYRIFFENSNFPHKCPVLKANYTVALESFDKAAIPPGLPRNEWKFKFKWHLHERTIMVNSFELKVDQKKPRRPKNDHH